MMRLTPLFEIISMFLAGMMLIAACTTNADRHEALTWTGLAAAAVGIWVSGLPVTPSKRTKRRG